MRRAVSPCATPSGATDDLRQAVAERAPVEGAAERTAVQVHAEARVLSLRQQG